MKARLIVTYNGKRYYSDWSKGTDKEFEKDKKLIYKAIDNEVDRFTIKLNNGGCHIFPKEAFYNSVISIEVKD